MLKEIRKLWVKDRAKARKIINLQYTGKLKIYFSEAGYKQYDTEEFAEYCKRGIKGGRPRKIQLDENGYIKK